ncbi:E3 ubiquitin-protein ligase GW2-like isoform X1 [Zingiber officinale]|uniref:E3 ubiquitin-protein ligase GW2-like isoform X1 n=1 Tax=Zingiber officinale TaxID=94328 RepID=UPI001C4B5EBA|nr:E3 ubiquitin-protein ligase GW2-like isoform X1 [Zingiber officinale]
MGNKIGRKRQVVDEQYTRPQGLYQHRGIDQKKLRKLILESKLAPCYPGCDEYALDLEECPICFWYYPSLNRSRCCMKEICTECFLQMKPPNVTRPTLCPFCKTSNYAVEYHGMKTKEEKGMEEVEEQKVIEAKIRIQQQEIQDEGKRLKKRQDTSSSRRMISAEGEIQDEAKRLKKRQDSCSSSKTIDPTDDYCNIAVPSFKLSTQTSEIFPSQASCSVPAPSNSRNRTGNFDMDFDDMNMMVMEAICLSIQEHGYHGYPAYFGDFFPGPSFSEESYHSHGIVPEVSSYGGLACAAAVTEHQPVNALSASNMPSSSTSVFDMIHRSGNLSAENTRFVQTNSSVHWSDIPPQIEREVQRWDLGECSSCYWSDMAEAGTSYTGSHAMVDTENALIPYPDRALMNQGYFVPESFEEQMMIAMSVSLADAQGWMNTQQELMWL